LIGRVVVATAVSLAAVAATAGIASAHVEVQPAQAAAGQPGNFAFRVPNEEDNAATVSLVVHFPVDHPIATAQPAPLTGWTSQVTMRPLARPQVVGGVSVSEVVDTVAWTGGRIEPGHAQYFNVTTGPLPTDAPSIMFTADQTYSNGDVVKWDQPEPPGAPEPPHPAPVLELTGGVAGPTTPAAVTTVATSAAPASVASVVADPPSSHDSGVSPWVVAVIVVAGVAVVGGLVLLWLRPRSRASHR
jgi:uncharacterized protein YcnI